MSASGCAYNVRVTFTPTHAPRTPRRWSHGWVRWGAGLLMVGLGWLAVTVIERDRPLPSLLERWAPPPSTFVAIGSQWVHIRDEGPRDDPTPIVLIHGTSASLHTWEGWAQVMSAQRRVIRFDLPGMGLTGPWAPDPSLNPGSVSAYAADDYRTTTLTQFARDVLNQLKLSRVIVMGNSLGGEIAWRLAALEPQRVLALVLVDASGPAFTPQSVPLGFAMARLPGMEWVAPYLLGRPVVRASVANVYGRPERVSSQTVDRYHELSLRSGNRRALVLRLRQMQWGQDLALLNQLRQPTLVLWGRQDKLIPLAVASEFTSRISGARLIVYDDLGHVPHEEDPARTVRDVQQFLATL